MFPQALKRVDAASLMSELKLRPLTPFPQCSHSFPSGPGVTV